MDTDQEITPRAAVVIALQQRDTTAPGAPLVEVLERSAPLGAAFWTEAAAELHRRDLHFDAYDCWTKALQQDADSVDRADMADTLWTVSSGKGFLAEEALRNYELAGAWQDVAYARHRLGRDKAEVLQAIESALEENPSSLEWEEYWGIDEFSEIWGWYALAHYYLEQNEGTKAIRTFGKALVAEPQDMDLVTSVSNALAEYVNSRAERGVAHATIQPDLP